MAMLQQAYTQFYRNVNTVNVLCDFCNFLENTNKYSWKCVKILTNKYVTRVSLGLSYICFVTFRYMKNKNQLDATYYFIVLLIGSTCFRHYYAHHRELGTIMLITTLVVSFLVCCRLKGRCSQAGVVSGLQAVVLQPAALTPLKLNCTYPSTYSKPRMK